MSVQHDIKDRRCTNLSSLLVFVAFIITTLGLCIYCINISHLDRLIQGYDDCGNTCGLKNDENKFLECGPTDKQNQPKLQVDKTIKGNVTIFHFTCVKECLNGYKEFFNRCWKTNLNSSSIDDVSFFQRIPQELIHNWKSLLAVCGIAFVFSYIVLILFRYFIEYIIWIVYILFVILFTVGAVACWIIAIISQHKNKGGIFSLAIILTILVILSIIMLIWNRKRIKLIAEIFKEASKALMDIPAIFFEPIIDFIALVLTILIFIYFAIVTSIAGQLTAGKAPDGLFQATFEPTVAVYIARILNVIAFIWFSQFIFGCQNFVIAGTVSKWYFTRDKSKLDAPIRTTYKQLVMYHLGSICLGSIIIMILKIIKAIVRAIMEQTRNSSNAAGQCAACCCGFLIEQLDQFLQYLIRNSYIVMSIDGTPFFESGRRAFDLLFKNLKNVIALNNFGDLVLFMSRLFVVLIAGFIGYALMAKDGLNSIFPIILAIIFAYFIANCFINVFEVTIDTIFVCYCKDIVLNDGVAKPYFMSEGLSTAMDELKASAERKPLFNRRVGVEAGQRRY